MHTPDSDLPANDQLDAATPPSEVLVDQNAISTAATERALRELLEMVPEDAFTHYKFAIFLAEQQRTQEAAAQFRRALELQPDFPDALRTLAALLSAQRDFAGAIELLRRAVAIRPDDVQALCDLGNALVNIKRGGEAIVILQHALRLLPGEYRLHSNLGLAFMDAGMFEEAETALQEALRIKPMFVGAHINLGNLYIVMSQCDRACACFDLAENIERNNLHARCNRAIALLSMGDFPRGWRDYQFRWDRPESPHRAYPQPLWLGEDLKNRRILLYTEEGLGDRIQFIRYAELLHGLGAHVICECPIPLMDVFHDVRGIHELVELGSPLPPFDCHAPLLSLPHFFNTTLATVPAKVPYLTADPEYVAAWRQRLGQSAKAGELLIGVAWQGNPHHQWDRFRSMPLMQLEPLAAIPGVRFVSLQRGPGIEQIETFQRFTGHKMIVPTDGGQTKPADLADSAAIMSCLDLILTVDTATAHLAGALARNAWVMLSSVTDWRWMTDRHDSPWYPTMRLFRQKRFGDWDELIGRVAGSITATRMFTPPRLPQ